MYRHSTGIQFVYIHFCVILLFNFSPTLGHLDVQMNIFFLMVFSLSMLFVGALSSWSCSFLPQFGFTQDLNASSLCGRWFQIGEWRREAAKRVTVECSYGPVLLETFGIHVNTPPSYPHGRTRKLRYLSPSRGGWGLLPGALTLLQLAHAQLKLASIARKNLQARRHKGS